MARIVTIVALLFALVLPIAAQSPTPVYVVVGDSIEFGLGDEVLADGMGYVPLVQAFLTSFFAQAVAAQNFGTPFATARDVLQGQVPAALAAASGHAPVIVSWGGGGNDLGKVATGPQAAACRRSESCLGRFAGLLNEVEVTISHTIALLRATLGPDAVILMRTQYNALLRPGCASPEVAALGNATLEGVPGTVLARGLNDRIRDVAAAYHARVVDVFLPFAALPDQLVANDCIHPNEAGYQMIGALSMTAFATP